MTLNFETKISMIFLFSNILVLIYCITSLGTTHWYHISSEKHKIRYNFGIFQICQNMCLKYQPFGKYFKNNIQKNNIDHVLLAVLALLSFISLYIAHLFNLIKIFDNNFRLITLNLYIFNCKAKNIIVLIYAGLGISSFLFRYSVEEYRLSVFIKVYRYYQGWRELKM